MRLKSKIALVTGAASGIGAATVKRFAMEGAIVYATDINEPKAPLAGTVTFVRHDVTDEAMWLSLKTRIDAEHGRLDVLVNNAGFVTREDDIENGNLALWNKTMSVNATGAFLGCHTLLDLLKKSAAASVVNVSSVVVFKTRVEVAYAASKAAVWGLTTSMAVYCSRHGYPIRCNTVHPGGVETDIIRNYINSMPEPESVRQSIVEEHLIKRLAQPDEIANGIVYLASDEAGFVTGSALTIDGGMRIN